MSPRPVRAQRPSGVVVRGGSAQTHFPAGGGLLLCGGLRPFVGKARDVQVSGSQDGLLVSPLRACRLLVAESKLAQTLRGVPWRSRRGDGARVQTRLWISS